MSFDPFGNRENAEATWQGLELLKNIFDFFFSRPRVLFWSLFGFIVGGALLGAHNRLLLIIGVGLIAWGISLRRSENMQGPR